jgi:hypothetical protein
MMKTLTTAALAGFGALATLMLPILPSPALADSTRTLNCVGAAGSISCVATRRGGVANPHITQVPAPVSEQDTAEQERRDKAWQARCKPVIRQDQFGVPRYIYAAHGCEYGRLD